MTVKIRNEKRWKRLLPLVTLSLLIAASCGPPAKVALKEAPVCARVGAYGHRYLGGVPMKLGDPGACLRAIAPVDAAVWLETPFNSRKIRGRSAVELGCKALTAAMDNSANYGLPGQSTSALLNFDLSVFPEDAAVRRVVLAVHSPDGAGKLAAAYLRGRLNAGDELQSLGDRREVSAVREKGWVMFDITTFGARAINERRNSVHFELSLPCQSPAENLASMSLTGNEARVLVEYY